MNSAACSYIRNEDLHGTWDKSSKMGMTTILPERANMP